MKNCHNKTRYSKIKKQLFQSSDKNIIEDSVTLFERTVLNVLIEKEVLFIVVPGDGSIQVLNKEAFLKDIDSGITGHHFALRLDLLINEILALLNLETKVLKIVQQHTNTKK